MRTVRELIEGSMEVSRDAVEKKCDEVTDSLERATRAYSDIADSLVRGIAGVDAGRGEKTDLLRSMRMELAALFKAHDRVAAIKKAMKTGSIAMVPKGDPL